MTIAAGFVCKDGVILCADTQETIPGYARTDVQKLRSFEVKGINLFFAGAGNNGIQVDASIEEITDNLRDSPEDLADARRFVRVLRDAVRAVFPMEYYPRAETEVDLLMAVQFSSSAKLYRITDCSVASVTERVCVGAGLVLANQLLQRYYSWDASLLEAAIISLYVLYHAKKWVPSCGGNTDIALIPNIGGRMSYMPTEEVEKIEKYCEAHDKALQRLLTAVPRHPKNKEAFDNEVRNAVIGLTAARSAFQEWEDVMKEVAAHLGRDYEEMMREAEEGANRFLNPPPSDSQTSEGQQ